MKLKKVILTAVYFQSLATLQASDLIVSMNVTTINLRSAQLALTTLLTPVSNPAPTIENPSQNVVEKQESTTPPSQEVESKQPEQKQEVTPSSQSEQKQESQAPEQKQDEPKQKAPDYTLQVLAPTNISMITNNSDQTVHLIMLNTQSEQINPIKISLTPDAFSYIPKNVTTVKILNTTLDLIVTIPVTTNSSYSITNENNKWSIEPLPAATDATSYVYKNSTNVPLIVAIKAGHRINRQHIAPGEEYNQKLIPATAVQINSHANLAPIWQSYNPKASYNIAIGENNKLLLTKTSENGKILMNKSDWPMLISLTLPDMKRDYKILQNNEQFEPEATATNVMIIPLIMNNESKKASARSCTITNTNGLLRYN